MLRLQQSDEALVVSCSSRHLARFVGSWSNVVNNAAYHKLEICDLFKAYRVDGKRLEVLHGIDLHAEAETFVTLIGPSGCGKSTLFSIICGLQQPDRGKVCLDGAAAQERLGKVGYMPQRDLLLPWRSVLDNVVLGPEIQGQALASARAQASELLPLFGLEGFASSYPAALSGGMRQRAALLRTFLLHKDILLLDEPFGALDALTRNALQQWLLEVWQRFRQTVLFITHDVEEAAFLSDKVYVLSPRPARVCAEVAISLPRPRRREMTLTPEFTALKQQLLQALSNCPERA
jgi:ABC-type nitrate/sulfonate/bicarbonate transport system ATPase subunit